MKAITFYTFLFSLLLSGVNSYCATANHDSASHSTSYNLHKNHKSTLNHKHHVGTLTNNVDFDLEDDFSGNDDVKTVVKNKFLSLNYNWDASAYLTRTNLLLLHHFSKSFNNSQPLCGNSTPIYISLRVLRI